MTLSANDLAAPGGNSFKFANIGDTIEGALVYVGEPYERKNKFNDREERVIKLGIDTGNGEILFIYPVVGTQMASAIADALRNAGIGSLEAGQTLKVRYDEDVDTGKGNPMKKFKAKVTPGTTAAVEEPF